MYNSQDTETSKLPIDRGIDKERVVYVHTMGIRLSHKKGWSDAIGSNMEGPNDDHMKSDREQMS